MISRASLPKARLSGNRSRHLARGGVIGAGAALPLAAVVLVPDNWLMRVQSGALLAVLAMAGLACDQPDRALNNGTPAGPATGAPPSGATRGNPLPPAGATGGGATTGSGGTAVPMGGVAGADGTAGSGAGGGGITTTTAALQYDGSLAFAPAVVVGPERVEISAPILPRLDVIYG